MSAVATKADLNAMPYDIALSINGAFESGATYLTMIMPYAVNMKLSTAKAYVANTASASATVVSIAKNGTIVANVTYATGATSGTFSATSNVSFVAGDILKVYQNGTPDALIKNGSIVLTSFKV
jgi:hypothetical protein